MRSVAVVGSGPSGCYCTEALLRAAPDVRVDVIDRLPTPFGLVRSGVAPDHQSTKGVARLLDRVLAKPEVGFFGGVELERDVTLEEVRSLYDAVVIATGAAIDKRLGIPGETLPGVHASGAFVGWYNHHPDRLEVDLSRVRSAVVVGSGNVALDVARILAKSADEFHGSDLDENVLAALGGAPLERITIAGRSPATGMKFTEAELIEFGELARARATLGFGADDVAELEGKVPSALRQACAADPGAKPIEIVFEFGLTPIAFAGDAHLEAVRFLDRNGAEVVREAQLAVTCIGYSAHDHGLARDGVAIRNDDGAVDAGLYVVGWAKRGPSGTIPTNRTEAQAVAKRIVTDVVADGDRAGHAGLVALLRERNVRYADHAAWRRIDASEIARAGEARSRRKWRSLSELFDAASAGA